VRVESALRGDADDGGGFGGSERESNVDERRVRICKEMAR
jgi:hypothetical protein